MYSTYSAFTTGCIIIIPNCKCPIKKTQYVSTEFSTTHTIFVGEERNIFTKKFFFFCKCLLEYRRVRNRSIARHYRKVHNYYIYNATKTSRCCNIFFVQPFELIMTSFYHGARGTVQISPYSPIRAFSLYMLSANV